MKTKHTPGPWFADKPFFRPSESQKVTPIYARDPGHLGGLWLVAWCHQNAVPKQQVAPNAGLIAAAPDLLAALQELRYACTDKAKAMADAAIAKALHAPANR